MPKLTVSASALNQFMSGCPARYTFYQKFNMVKVPPAMDFGIRVHRMLESGLPNPHTTPADLDAAEIAERLLNLVEKAGYKILEQEVRHIAPLTADIQVFGIIDAIAELDGEPVLIDFKTGARQWKKWKTEDGEVFVPKALGFQGPIYLTPPNLGSTSDYWKGKVWPGELHYLLAPNDGPTTIYHYYDSVEDRQNLIRACTMLKDAVDRGWFPLNRGWLCADCDWFPACYRTVGWERHYVERKQHGDTETEPE